MTKHTTVEVTYQGPGSAYRVPDFEGAEYVLPRGVPTSVPQKLATRLVKAKDQRFALNSPHAEAPESDEKPEDPKGSTQSDSTVRSDDGRP